jgi:hypothetical protein
MFTSVRDCNSGAAIQNRGFKQVICLRIKQPLYPICQHTETGMPVENSSLPYIQVSLLPCSQLFSVYPPNYNCAIYVTKKSYTLSWTTFVLLLEIRIFQQLRYSVCTAAPTKLIVRPNYWKKLEAPGLVDTIIRTKALYPLPKHSAPFRNFLLKHTHTHTHTHIKVSMAARIPWLEVSNSYKM